MLRRTTADRWASSGSYRSAFCSDGHSEHVARLTQASTDREVRTARPHEHVFDMAAKWFNPTKCLPARSALSATLLWRLCHPASDRLRKAAVLLHSLDLQRLDDDRLVFVSQSSSQRVLEIASAVGDAFVRRGDKASGRQPGCSILSVCERGISARTAGFAGRVT
jgi:hypothetical protein